MSRKPPLLWASDGNTPLVADDSEEKLRALCLAAFGALKGIAKDGSGRTVVVEDQQAEHWRSKVANYVVETLGQESVERYWGVKLAREALPHVGKGSETVQ